VISGGGVSRGGRSSVISDRDLAVVVALYVESGFFLRDVLHVISGGGFSRSWLPARGCGARLSRMVRHTTSCCVSRWIKLDVLLRSFGSDSLFLFILVSISFD
jgi:hypothetical protein